MPRVKIKIPKPLCDHLRARVVARGADDHRIMWCEECGGILRPEEDEWCSWTIPPNPGRDCRHRSRIAVGKDPKNEDHWTYWCVNCGAVKRPGRYGGGTWKTARKPVAPQNPRLLDDRPPGGVVGPRNA